MSLSATIAPHLPFLRRFSRAVSGSQHSGDALVAALLETIIADISIFPKASSDRIALYKLFASEADYRTMVNDHLSGGFGYGHFKTRLADAYWDYFAPMRARRAEILADPGYVDAVLARGAERAREEAAKVIDRVRRAVGLR